MLRKHRQIAMPSLPAVAALLDGRLHSVAVRTSHPRGLLHPAKVTELPDLRHGQLHDELGTEEADCGGG